MNSKKYAFISDLGEKKTKVLRAFARIILIYTKSGYLGEHLSPMLGGLIGSIKYIIPIGTFLISINFRHLFQFQCLLI